MLYGRSNGLKAICNFLNFLKMCMVACRVKRCGAKLLYDVQVLEFVFHKQGMPREISLFLLPSSRKCIILILLHSWMYQILLKYYVIQLVWEKVVIFSHWNTNQWNYFQYCLSFLYWKLLIFGLYKKWKLIKIYISMRIQIWNIMNLKAKYLEKVLRLKIPIHDCFSYFSFQQFYTFLSYFIIFYYFPLTDNSTFLSLLNIFFLWIIQYLFIIIYIIFYKQMNNIKFKK